MANGNFGGGDGSKENPYLVEDAWDFDAVRNEPTKHYKQTKDIDLSVFENFRPISDVYWVSDPFYGSYDGSNKKIKNATIISIDRSIDRSKYNGHGGLFGTVANATLKNIIIENIHVMADAYVGALVGAIHNTYYWGDELVLTTIENCHVISGTMISGGYRSDGVTPWDGYQTGGLIGIVDTARSTEVEIKKCSAKCKVLGGVSIGGLIGMLNIDDFGVVRISDCFAQSIVGPFAFNHFWGLGGFIGDVGAYDDSNIEVKNCYAASVFTEFISSGNDSAFGFFGDIYVEGGRGRGTAYLTVESNYYDSELCTLTDSQGAQPKTTEEMKKKATFVGWDFSLIWGIEENVKYPFFIDGQPQITCRSMNLKKSLFQ